MLLYLSLMSRVVFGAFERVGVRCGWIVSCACLRVCMCILGACLCVCVHVCVCLGLWVCVRHVWLLLFVYCPSDKFYILLRSFALRTHAAFEQHTAAANCLRVLQPLILFLCLHDGIRIRAQCEHNWIEEHPEFWHAPRHT